MVSRHKEHDVRVTIWGAGWDERTFYLANAAVCDLGSFVLLENICCIIGEDSGEAIRDPVPVHDARRKRSGLQIRHEVSILSAHNKSLLGFVLPALNLFFICSIAFCNCSIVSTVEILGSESHVLIETFTSTSVSCAGFQTPFAQLST